MSDDHLPEPGSAQSASHAIDVGALLRRAALSLDVITDPALIDANAAVAGIYAALLDRGAERAEVALAALGAMIGLFDHAGMLAALPDVLRQTADTLDDELDRATDTP